MSTSEITGVMSYNGRQLPGDNQAITEPTTILSMHDIPPGIGWTHPAAGMEKARIVPNMPPRVKIGPMTYIVTLSHDRITEYNRCAEKEYIGVAKHDLMEIIVDSGMPRCKEQHTLLHEINHAIEETYAIASDDVKERRADTLATAWLALLHDNPALVAYLTAKEG